MLMGRVGIIKVFFEKGSAAIPGCSDWWVQRARSSHAVCTAVAGLADSELLVVLIWAWNPAQEESLWIAGAGFRAKGV